MEQIEVATSIAGRAVKSSAVRNNASRVALPLMNCAVTMAAQNMAVRMVIAGNASAGAETRSGWSERRVPGRAGGRKEGGARDGRRTRHPIARESEAGHGYWAGVVSGLPFSTM